MWLNIIIFFSFLITLYGFNLSTPLPLVQFSPSQQEGIVDSQEVTETQHATCHIITEHLAATAKATVTRALKGVCNSKDLEGRFNNLETQLVNQVNVLKLILIDIEKKMTAIDKILKDPTNLMIGNLHTASKKNFFQTQEDRLQEFNPENPRQAEINNYNYTVYLDSSGDKVFVYYWTFPYLDYKHAEHNSIGYLRSPSFYINNTYRMYLKIFPRQNEENTYIYVGLTPGVFDDDLKWPYSLKTKVSILDQTFLESTQDLSSKIWKPESLCNRLNWLKPVQEKNKIECVGLGFPKKVLHTRNYIKSFNIIVKLNVYFD